MKIKHLFGLALLMVLLGAGCAVETLTQDSVEDREDIQEDATKYAPNPYMNASKLCYLDNDVKYVDISVTSDSNPNFFLLRDDGYLEERKVSDPNRAIRITSTAFEYIDYVNSNWGFIAIDEDTATMQYFYESISRGNGFYSLSTYGIYNVNDMTTKLINSNTLEVYLLVPSGISEYVHKFTLTYYYSSVVGRYVTGVSHDPNVYSFHGMYGNGITEMEGKLWGQSSYYTAKFFKQSSISGSDRTFEVLPSGYTHHGFWNLGEKETFTPNAYDYNTYNNRLYGLEYLGSSKYAVATLPYSNINF